MHAKRPYSDYYMPTFLQKVPFKVILLFEGINKFYFTCAIQNFSLSVQPKSY